MPIRALIVDDEKLAREEMRYLLDRIPDVEIAGEAAGGEEAVRLSGELSPDVIFLDIQMPVVDGFDVVRTLLERGDPPLVVFTTAYDQYAIRAFEVNAVDYLLKPVDLDRLAQAVERARSGMPSRDEHLERLRKLAGHIRVGRKFLPRLVIRRRGEMALIDADKVAMLERTGEGIRARTVEGDFTTNYGEIDELEVQLDPSVFLRLGSDRIVNIRRIGEIVPWSGGHYLLTLDDAGSTEVRLTRMQAQLLKNKAEGI